MDILYTTCAGLDVHKDSVSVCVRRPGRDGKTATALREFSTMTEDILRMGDWMAAQGVTHVAMESTGVYWKPIWNLLEHRFELMLCNARDVKNVPGRKTDMRDCQWLAHLHQHGLLRPSFIPPKPQRELRDLTRHRAQLTSERTRAANRIAKTLEDANIKLGSVASDILGKSGRLMLKAISDGEEDPCVLADLAQRRLRAKIPALKKALQGAAGDHHRYMLRLLLDHVDYLDKAILGIEERIDLIMANIHEDGALPFDEAVQLLCTIPGFDKRTAQSVLAEIGTDMAPFPSANHLASWAGVCPGNNQSAGKRKSGASTHGNRWLKRALSQASWAASRAKNTYVAEQFRRLAHRRGRKRAIVAVSNTLLTIVYHLLEQRTVYQDLGAEYFDTITPERRVRHYTKQLEKLGFNVTLEPKEVAA